MHERHISRAGVSISLALLCLSVLHGLCVLHASPLSARQTLFADTQPANWTTLGPAVSLTEMTVIGGGQIPTATGAVTPTRIAPFSPIVLPAVITPTVSPASCTVRQGQTAEYIVGFESTPGFTLPVALDAGPFSGGTSYAFSPVSVLPGDTARLSITTTESTRPGAHEFTITGTAESLVGSVRATLEVRAPVYLPTVMERWPPIPYEPTLYSIGNEDGDGYYTVSWAEQPSHLSDTYSLEEATDAAFSSGLRLVCTTTQQWCIVSGRLSGTYYYRVRGYNKWGYGPYSNIQSATVLLPDTPTLYAIENSDGDGDYSVAWSAAARATSYTLQEDTDAGFPSPTTLSQGSGFTWPVSGRPVGTYYYRVKANGLTGQSGWSNTQAVAVVPPISIVERNGIRFIFWYREGSTWIEAYSEVRNNTQQNVRDVEVFFNVYNNAGTLIATDTGFSMLDVIRPGQTSPVEFYFDVPGGADTLKSSRVEITVRDNWSFTSTDTQNTFEIVSHSTFRDDYGARHVLGEARNTRGTIDDLQVTVLVRGRGDYQDWLLAAEQDWVWDVAPGETVPFEVIFWKNFGGYYGYYEIILED